MLWISSDDLGKAIFENSSDKIQELLMNKSIVEGKIIITIIYHCSHSCFI